MFYVAERLPIVKVMYKLLDFTTKEKQSASRDELKERVLSGEIIVGVSVVNDDVVIKTKGKLGDITLEDFAILTGKQYLIDEFDCETNNITPDKVPYGRKLDYHWICSKGHPFSARLAHRTYMNSGCPYCANQKVLKGYNDFETWCRSNNQQDLLDEWDYEKNTEGISDISPFSNKSCFWICPFGHKYHPILNSRTGGLHIGCPHCHNQTLFPEQAILYYLRNSDLPNVDSRFQYKVGTKKYEIDIFIPSLNIGIEYDGDAWHGGDDKIELDERKNKILSEAGIKLIRMCESGCPNIESFSSKVIIVNDFDDCIRKLIRYLASNFGVFFKKSVSSEQDRAIILSEYRSSKKQNSIAYMHPSIVREWAYDLNENLRPEMFSAGSKEKIWWRCPICNREYKSPIVNRYISLRGCQDCNSSGNNNQFTQNVTFKDKYEELLSFVPEGINALINKLSPSTRETINIICPNCKYEEKEKYFSNRVKIQRGLTCKNCDYHIDYSEYKDIEKVTNDIPGLAAGFAENPKQSNCFFRTEPKEVAACQRYEFVSLYAGSYSISEMCRILDVSRQVYRKHLKSKDKPDKHAALLAAIQAIREEDEYNDTYGRERLQEALVLCGISVSLSTLYRIVQLTKTE